MYYKIYKIPNDELYKNINILRFSFNPFYDTIIDDHRYKYYKNNVKLL